MQKNQKKVMHQHCENGVKEEKMLGQRDKKQWTKLNSQEPQAESEIQKAYGKMDQKQPRYKGCPLTLDS